MVKGVNLSEADWLLFHALNERITVVSGAPREGDITIIRSYLNDILHMQVFSFSMCRVLRLLSSSCLPLRDRVLIRGNVAPLLLYESLRARLLAAEEVLFDIHFMIYRLASCSVWREGH